VTPGGPGCRRRPMRALQLEPGNHRELLLRLFFAAPLERPNCGAMSKRSAESNKPVSSTTKTCASGWTMPQVHNPRLPIWKLVLEYGVLLSESRVIHTPSLFFNGSGQQ